MDEVFLISIVGNVLGLFAIGYMLLTNDVIRYLKRRLNTNSERTNTTFNSHYDFKLGFFENMPTKPNEIIFLGDSLTALCNWNELFDKENIKNRGISGDTIHGVIHRLTEVVRFKPKKIFLMIGINDLGGKRSVHQILDNYEELITVILNKTPNTELYIQSILPTHNQSTKQNKDIIEINKGLIALSKKHQLTFINLFDKFKTEEKTLNMNLSYDGLHLNANGYMLWKNIIIKYLDH